MQYSPMFTLLGYRLVMSGGLRLHGNSPLFGVSDSRGSSLECLPGGLRPDRTGSNGRNTHSGKRSRSTDQAPSYQKANGAGFVTPKRSRLVGHVTTSGLGEVSLG